MAIPVVTLGPKLIDIKGLSPSSGDMIEWNGTNFVVIGKTGTGSVVRATSPTLTTPVISDYTSAQHAHTGAASGGLLDAAAIGSGVLLNGRVNWAAPSAIGAATPAAGSFTNLTVGTDSTSNLSLSVRGPASSVSDGAFSNWYRGGTWQWQVGVDGSNNFNNEYFWYNVPNSAYRMSLSPSGKLGISTIGPLADSTTALKFTKADGSTAVVTLDTTNSRVGIGITPNYPLEISANTASHALHVSNAGGNTSSYGIYATSSISTAIYGDIDNSHAAVYGNNATGPGVQAISVYSPGIVASSGTAAGVFTTTDATAGITNVAILNHVLSSGGASAGFGPGLLLRGTSGTAGTTREMGYMYAAWTEPTDLSRASKVVIGGYNVGTPVDVLTLAATSAISTVTITPASGGTTSILQLNVPSSSVWNIKATAALEILGGGSGTTSVMTFDGASYQMPQRRFIHGLTADTLPVIHEYTMNSSVGGDAYRLSTYNDSGSMAVRIAVTAMVNTANVVFSNSNVGIGKTPAIALDVNGGIRTGGDPGSGAASTTTLTNATGTPVNAVTPAGYIKVYIGTVASYVPYFQ